MSEFRNSGTSRRSSSFACCWPHAKQHPPSSVVSVHTNLTPASASPTNESGRGSFSVKNRNWLQRERERAFVVHSLDSLRVIGGQNHALAAASQATSPELCRPLPLKILGSIQPSSVIMSKCLSILRFLTSSRRQKPLRTHLHASPLNSHFASEAPDPVGNGCKHSQSSRKLPCSGWGAWELIRELPIVLTCHQTTWPNNMESKD